LALLANDTVSVGRLAGNRLAQLAVQASFADLASLGAQVPALAGLAAKVATSQKSILSLLSGVDPTLAASVLSRISNSAERDRFATETITNDDMAAAVSLMPYLMATVVRLGDRMLAYTALTATNAAELLRVINTPGYLNAVQTAITGQLPRSLVASHLSGIDFGSLFKDVATQPAFREVPILTTFNNMGGFGTISGLMVLAVIAAKYIENPVATWQDQLSIVGAVFTFVSYASHYIKSYAAMKGLLSTTSTVAAELAAASTKWGGFRDALASINVATSNDITRVERITYALLKKKYQNGLITVADVKNALASHFYTVGDLDGAAKEIYARNQGELKLDPRTSFTDVIEALRDAPLNNPLRAPAITAEAALVTLTGTKELQSQFDRTPTDWKVKNQTTLSAYLQKHLPISEATADAFAQNIDLAAKEATPGATLTKILLDAAKETRTRLASTIDADEESGGVSDDVRSHDLALLQADQNPTHVIADSGTLREQIEDISEPGMSEAQKDSRRVAAANAEWNTLYDSVKAQVLSSDGNAPRLAFDAVAARTAAVLSHTIVLGDLGSGIVGMILAIDLMRNGDYAAGVSGIVFATVYIVASILEVFGAAAFEFGGFLLAIIAAIIELILEMLPPDPSKDRGALYNWAKPYADAGLLADPSAGPNNVSITALQYWHEHSQNPTSPFPSCTSTDLDSCTYNPKNAPARGCLQNLGDGTYMQLAYAGSLRIGGVYAPQRGAACDGSDNHVLVFPELGGDIVRIIAPGSAPQYPGDYALVSKQIDTSGVRGGFYFENTFEPDATNTTAEWTRHTFADGSFQLESASEPGQCLTLPNVANGQIDSMAACNVDDGKQHWKWTATN
jgi:hypothetical protein